MFIFLNNCHHSIISIDISFTIKTRHKYEANFKRTFTDYSDQFVCL